mmetsp:Transcript_9356/g.57021  ORF Transcript_9356/g.57021 Transcript_9356/m.57021 type:complete len:187 (-) Transcript_9356:991-1551(-)
MLRYLKVEQVFSSYTSQLQMFKHLCASGKCEVQTVLIVTAIRDFLGRNIRDGSTLLSAVSPPLESQAAYLPSLSFFIGLLRSKFTKDVEHEVGSESSSHAYAVSSVVKGCAAASRPSRDMFLSPLHLPRGSIQVFLAYSTYLQLLVLKQPLQGRSFESHLDLHAWQHDKHPDQNQSQSILWSCFYH